MTRPLVREIQRMLFYFIFLGCFAARKVLDQRRSRRNVRRLQEQRHILPTRDRALPWMLLTHVAFFVLTPLEVVLLDREFMPALGIPMIGLFLLAVLLRWWATSLLKEHWSSRVVVPEDLQPVTTGPYQMVRHPNYLAVSLELLAAGLMYSAFLSTAFVAVLNLCAIVKRIHTEEEVLFHIPAYRAAMADKARLIPGIY